MRPAFLKTLFLTLLLAIAASTTVNAKLASGPQNLGLDVHQAQSLLEPAPRLGWSGSSYDGASESPVVTRGAANLSFRSGDVILREFQTSRGILDVAAETQVVGRTLHLKDIAVFPRGADALSLGTREVVALRNQLAAEARSLGFEQLRITGTRVSGANPGKAVDIAIDLTK